MQMNKMCLLSKLTYDLSKHDGRASINKRLGSVGFFFQWNLLIYVRRTFQSGNVLKLSRSARSVLK